MVVLCCVWIGRRVNLPFFFLEFVDAVASVGVLLESEVGDGCQRE